jgi:hypothetical protein
MRLTYIAEFAYVQGMSLGLAHTRTRIVSSSKYCTDVVLSHLYGPTFRRLSWYVIFHQLSNLSDFNDQQWGETYNHVFGRTTNPYNRKLTPGGSSGGEGALLAMKGSPLGVGTDVGGYDTVCSQDLGWFTRLRLCR